MTTYVQKRCKVCNAFIGTRRKTSLFTVGYMAWAVKHPN